MEAATRGLARKTRPFFVVVVFCLAQSLRSVSFLDPVSLKMGNQSFVTKPDQTT